MVCVARKRAIGNEDLFHVDPCGQEARERLSRRVCRSLVASSVAGDRSPAVENLGDAVQRRLHPPRSYRARRDPRVMSRSDGWGHA